MKDEKNQKIIDNISGCEYNTGMFSLLEVSGVPVAVSPRGLFFRREELRCHMSNRL